MFQLIYKTKCYRQRIYISDVKRIVWIFYHHHKNKVSRSIIKFTKVCTRVGGRAGVHFSIILGLMAVTYNNNHFLRSKSCIPYIMLGDTPSTLRELTYQGTPLHKITVWFIEAGWWVMSPEHVLRKIASPQFIGLIIYGHMARRGIGWVRPQAEFGRAYSLIWIPEQFESPQSRMETKLYFAYFFDVLSDFLPKILFVLGFKALIRAFCHNFWIILFSLILQNQNRWKTVLYSIMLLWTAPK